MLFVRGCFMQKRKDFTHIRIVNKTDKTSARSDFSLLIENDDYIL